MLTPHAWKLSLLPSYQEVQLLPSKDARRSQLMDQNSVPKFASFKKKPASNNENPRHERDETSHRSYVRAAHTSVSNVIIQREGDHAETSVDGEASRIAIRNFNVSKTSTNRPFVSGNEESEPQVSDLFLVDRRGDPHNITFEKIHKYDIPHYTRSGCGRIIGGSLFRIDREASTDRNIILTNRSHVNYHAQARLLSSKKGRTSESPTRLMIRSSDGAQNDQGCNYLDLGSLEGVHPEDTSDPSWDVNRDILQPESETGNIPFRVDQDISRVCENVAQTSEGQENAYSRQNTELSKTAHANTNNVDLWLELADHQRHLIRPNTDVSQFTQTERRSLAELRTAVLSTALKKIEKQNPERDHVCIEYMFEGRQIWERAKILAKWEETLFGQKDCPTSAKLWISYLEHVQQDHIAFEFDECRSEFIRCLRKLKAAHRYSDRVEQTQIDIFLQYTRFLRESGYNELAFAHWQIVFEYRFFLPEQLATASWEDQMEALASFWESDQPRIGEVNAEGWNVALSQGSGFKRQQEKRKPYEAGTPPSCRTAALEELKLSDDFWLAASIADDDTDDPFRHVMFTDLSDILDALIAGISRNDLLNAFLQFFGLPRLPVGPGCDSTSLIWKPVPAHCGNLGCFDSSPATGKVNIHPDQLKVRFQEETDSSLFLDNAFAAAYNEASIHPDQRKDIAQYLDRTLAMLASTNRCSDALAIYHIAYKAKFATEEVIKTAKGHLYRRSSGLRLPNAYALTEAVHGKKDKADRLWKAALENRFRIPGGEDDMIAVLQTSLKFYLHIDEESRALGILTTVYGDGLDEQQLLVNSAKFRVLYLRAEQELQQGLDQMILREEWLRAAMHTDCLAILAYMFNGHDLDRTLTTYDAFNVKLLKVSHKSILEIMQQNKAALISMHLSRQRSFKLATIEESLEQSLKHFPDNSMLIAAFSEIVSHDRIRAVLKKAKSSVASSNSVVGICHTIASEIQRSDALLESDNAHAVRSAFAAALLKLDGVSGCSPFLWFRWFKFELAQLRNGSNCKSEKSRLKDVFFHGMRHIPWVKSWAVTGMALLSDELSGEQTMQIRDILMRRGLRLRSSLTWET